MSSGTIHAELVKEDPAAALLLENPESAEKLLDIQKTSHQDFENRTLTTTTSTTTQDNADQEASLDFFDADGASFWDVLASYSMLLLWIQGFAFGIFTGISSPILNCCRLFVRDNSSNNGDSNNSNITHASRTTLVRGDHETIQHSNTGGGPSKYFYLMQSLLLGSNDGDGSACASVSSSSPSSIPHKQVNGPWPPPGLVILGILTVIALVVHPDGMTWVMLRKIRDAMLSILHSSTTCWDTMIRDYGMTVSASASIFLVLIVAIALHKVFLSNCCCSGGSEDTGTTGKRRHVSTAEKKRRRRKGKSNNNNARGRIKGAANTNSSTDPSLGVSRLPKVEEVSSDGAGDNSIRSNRSEDSVTTQDVDENDASDKPALEPDTNDVINGEERMNDAAMNVCSMEEETSIMTSPSAMESVVSSEEYEVKGKTPVPSICTVDMTSISDDVSCGSSSVRSGPPTRPPTNNRSALSTPTNTKGNTKPNNATKGNRKVNQRGGQKQSKTAPMAKWTTNSPPMTPMSRAEGLKAAKPVPKHPMSSSATESSTSKNPDGQPKRTPGAKGRNSAPQNSRGNRGKGGRATGKHHQPKNHNAARTVSPVPTTSDSSFPAATTPSPTPRNTPTIASGSPAGRTAGRNNNDDISSLFTSNENNNQSRLPPFSPYSQSLFSCELGASDWSLPALPVVSQPKNVAGTPNAAPSPSALSYSSNPFVTPYSQLPTEYNGHSSSVVPESNSSSLGLWNSNVQQKNSVPPSNLTTPQRSLRAPPGLSAPPGFAPVQPTLTTADLYTPNRFNNNDTPSLMPATPSSVGTSMTGQESSPFSWNSSTPNDPAIISSSPPPAMMIQSTPVVKKNPFANDTVSGVNADEVEYRIEAEMQELGGRMIGSVLDF